MNRPRTCRIGLAFVWIALVGLLAGGGCAHARGGAAATAGKPTAEQPVAAVTAGVQRAVLPNGMHVLLVRRPAVPIVSCVMAYHVGSSDESPGRSGMAHFLEHVMFKGTDRYAKGEIDLATMKHGGNNNAWTSEDMTCYHFNFASDRWEVALEIEANRMRHCVFDPKEVEAEKQVVIEELKSTLDSPWENLAQQVNREMFKGHPYDRPVIGYEKEVQAAKPEDLKAFYDRYYVPNNAALVLVGDLDPVPVLEKVRKLFGAIPAGEKIERRSFARDPQSAERRLEISQGTTSDRLLVSFPTVTVADPADPVFDVLSSVLAGGRSSRLYRRLVEEAQLASEVEGTNDTRQYPGDFSIQVETIPLADRGRVEVMVYDELARLAREPVSEAELRRAKNMVLAHFLYSHDTALGFAEDLAFHELLGSFDDMDRYVAQVEAVTAPALQALATRYFVPENRTVGWSLADHSQDAGAEGAKGEGRGAKGEGRGAKGDRRAVGFGGAGDAIANCKLQIANCKWVVGGVCPQGEPIPCPSSGLAARMTMGHSHRQKFAICNLQFAICNGVSRHPIPRRRPTATRIPAPLALRSSPFSPPPSPFPPPPPAPPENASAPRFDLGKTSQVRLDNGLTLLVLRTGDLPIAEVRAFVDADGLKVPDGLAGLAQLTGEMLLEGTRTRNSHQIAEQVEDVGGELAAGPTGLALKVLSKHLDFGLELTADLLRNPVFPDECLERQRNLALARLQSGLDEPDEVGQRLFRKLVYGGHPLGQTEDGDVESIQRITRNDVVGHHGRYYRPGNTILVVVGDVDAAKVLAKVRKCYGEWASDSVAFPPLPPVAVQSQPVQKYVNMELGQVEILLGHLGIRRNDPDYIPLQVMDYILGTGTGFTDRLSKTLRDERGLAYTVHADITASAGQEPGVFQAYMATRPKNLKAGIDGLREEISRFLSAPPGAEEVKNVQDYLIGSFVFDFETCEQLAEYLVTVTRFGLGLDYLTRYPDLVRRVTPAEIHRVARAYLHPDAMTLVVIGPVDENGQVTESAEDEEETGPLEGMPDGEVGKPKIGHGTR